MARLTRLCVPGWPHLVVQHGASGSAVFVDDEDRAAYHTHLCEAAAPSGVRLHAYGLFDDEVRLVATPLQEDSLGRWMQAIGRRYVATFNRRHGRRGGLWEGRFRSSVVDPEQHLLPTMMYAEGCAAGGLNPALGRWSSAMHHIGAVVEGVVSEPAVYWGLGNTPFDREAAYRVLVDRGLTDLQVKGILVAVQSGWPLGDALFVERLAPETERRLAPRPRGRPKLARDDVTPIKQSTKQEHK